MITIFPQSVSHSTQKSAIFSARASRTKPVFFVEMFGTEGRMAPVPCRFPTREAAEARAAQLNAETQTARNREPALRDSITGEDRNFVLGWQEWRNTRYQNVCDLSRVARKYRDWVAHRSEIVSASNRQPGYICPPTKTLSERDERFAGDAADLARDAWADYDTQIVPADRALKTVLALATGTETTRKFRLVCLDCNALMQGR